ncbi:hypothetical protein [Butyrivibrio sp. MC2013]|uniref:hypothetical protein n=1 Tax=Butyrivibrio sp. MC2013 TaxID=1280686 RepID=UPI0003F5C2E1|nr:hypothetical protein [Butyrivibrio sp. MC2013]
MRKMNIVKTTILATVMAMELLISSAAARPEVNESMGDENIGSSIENVLFDEK